MYSCLSVCVCVRVHTRVRTWVDCSSVVLMELCKPGPWAVVWVRLKMTTGKPWSLQAPLGGEDQLRQRLEQ